MAATTARELSEKVAVGAPSAVTLGLRKLMGADWKLGFLFIAPTVVTALNFLWIYDGSLGVLNYLLVKVFRVMPQGVGWLSEAGTAMASVVFVNVWRGFPFFGISFLAGIKAIPGEMYEAASVD